MTWSPWMDALVIVCVVGGLIAILCSSEPRS